MSCDVGGHITPDREREKVFMESVKLRWISRTKCSQIERFSPTCLFFANSNTQLIFAGGQTIVPRMVSDLVTRLLDFGT